MATNRNFYALEKLSAAVDELVTGAGRVQERLSKAAMCLVLVRADDIPDEELRRIFVGVKDDLTFETAKCGEGRIAATMQTTNDEDASAVARRILELYLDLNRRLR
jgi:hypothetical protein